MRGLLGNASKRAWRTTLACALAACGLASADEPKSVGVTSAPAMTGAAPAATPPDYNALYRDAYVNPNTCAPLGGRGQFGPPPEAVKQGIWTNPRRYRIYFAGDYLRYNISRGTLPQDQVLTTTSINLFWDDPNAQLLGALNADGGPLREGPNGNVQLNLFPTTVFPAPGRQLTPNDPEVRVNVNETLVPGEARMTTGDFDVSSALNGYRPKIGIELPNGNRIEASYFTLSDVNPPALVDNVSGAGFLTRQISSNNPLRFGMFRFGYIDSALRIDLTALPVTLQNSFQGEDVRRFDPVPSLFPHFPYNEIPQPTVTPDPTSPLLPLVSAADPEGIRASDIPREPTSQDFPGQSFLFQDGELAVATYRSDIQGLDFTYRHKIGDWNRSWYNLELLASFRWVNLNERFNFFFADLYNFSRTTATGPITPNAGNTGTPNIPQPPFFIPNDSPLDPPDIRGTPAEETQISIDRYTNNHLFGPQVGVDWRVPFCNFFDVQVASRAGWVFNSIETGARVARGDGLLLSDYSKTNLLTSGILDGQLGLNYYPHPNVRLNAGFEWLWLVGVGGAISNQALDLSVENRPKNNDDLLFTGWYVGGEVKF